MSGTSGYQMTQEAQQDGPVAEVDDIGQEAEVEVGGKLEAVPSEALADPGPSEADVYPREIEVVEASLREYFLNSYKGGGVFVHDAYEYFAADCCWIHRSSGIKVWQDALDLTQSGASGEAECLFHYTTQLGFRNITAPQKKAVEVFASLVTEGPDANAWWGAGVYTVRMAPHEWPDVATLIDNNYRNMHKRDLELKGREVADKEYASRVAYCIPILACTTMCYDVSAQQTPEMQTEGKPPGTNLAGKLLNEPGQPERQCVVIRVERGQEVGHASAVLVDTLRCRADATAERLGRDHPEALARVVEERGAFAEAESLHRQVLEAKERQLGPEHPVTLLAVHNLAFVLQRLGKFGEAERLYRRNLAGHEANLGPMHPSTLTSVNNLALLLEAQGKLDEAEELQRRDFAVCEKMLGVDHPNTLASINNLAVLLKQQGKLDEAEELQWRAVARRKAVLGVQHPHTLESIKNLAMLLQTQGKLDEAEDHYRRALAGREGGLGPVHPGTLESIRNLAELLEVKGSFAEAGQLYLREWRSMEELHGPDHKETQTSRRNWERFLREHGPIIG